MVVVKWLNKYSLASLFSNIRSSVRFSVGIVEAKSSCATEWVSVDTDKAISHRPSRGAPGMTLTQNDFNPCPIYMYIYIRLALTLALTITILIFYWIQ